MNPEYPPSPYVGLRPFRTDESLLFFGMQDLVLDLMERLHAHHFVGVVGSSGCGKSSLVLAGLIPRLRAGYLVDDRDGWKVSQMKPGDNPLYHLAEALLQLTGIEGDPAAVGQLVQAVNEGGSDPLVALLRPLWDGQQTNVLLLVDQFEELFRYGTTSQDPDHRDQAADMVHLILSLCANKEIPFYCVLTLRSDFIGDCSRFFGLAEALNQSQYLVPRLSRVQFRSIIEGPARLYGTSIHPALSARLLNDLSSTDDMLPLLQHCLMRIWDYHHQTGASGPLNLEEYVQVGGIEKALSNHADEALKGMSGDQKVLAKKLFQALTAVDGNGRKIRRPAHLEELSAITGAGKEEILAVVNRFIEEQRSFLVVSTTPDPAGPMIDISHESLIRQWATLRDWVEEESESSRSFLLLVESCKLFQEGKKDLLSGIELQQAMSWYRDFSPRQGWALRYSPLYQQSMDYLLQSQKQNEIRERQSRDQRKKKIALLVGIPMVMILLLSILGLDYFKNEKEARIKEAYRKVTLSLYNYLDVNPTATLRIVQAALQADPDSLIQSVADRIYQNNLFYKTILKGPSMTITDPGGNWILACPDSTHARIYRRVGMGLVIVHTWTRNNGGINCAAFSQDGKTILTGSKDHVVRLWTLDGNCREFSPQEDVITSVVFSPNEQRFLSRSNDGTIRLWKMDGSFIELNWPGQICETFFPQGDSILTGSVDGFLRIWDLKGKLRAQFDHVDQIMSVAISPDGENILEGSWNMTAQVLRTRDRHLESTLGHNTPLNLVRFSPDGSQVFVSGYNGNVRIWSMGGFFQQSGNINWVMKAELKDNMSRVRSMGITPEGDTLITASIDGSVRLWDIHRLNEPSDAPPSMSLEEFLHRGAIDSFSTREIDSMTAAPKIRAGKSKPKK